MPEWWMVGSGKEQRKERVWIRIGKRMTVRIPLSTVEVGLPRRALVGAGTDGTFLDMSP